MAWTTLVLAILLHLNKIKIHSDSLFLEALFNDILRNHGSWWDWKWTPAPAFFPDAFLYLVGYWILPNAYWHIFFVTACHALLLAVFGIWLCKRLYPSLSVAGQALIILVTAAAVQAAANSNMWLLFNSTNNHLPAFLGAALAFGLLLSFNETPTWRTALALIVVGTVAKLSSAVYSITLTAPAILLLGITLVVCLFSKSQSLHKNKIAFSLLLIAGSELLAAWLAPLATHHSPLTGRVGFSQAQIVNSLKWFLEATTEIAIPNNFYTTVFTLLTVATFGFVGIWLFSRASFFRNKNESWGIIWCDAAYGESNWRLIAACLFLLALVPVNLAGSILSGGFSDLYGYRYFIFIFLLGFVIAVAIADRLARFRRYITILVVFVSFILSLASAISWVALAKEQQRSAWSLPRPIYPEAAHIVAKRIQELRREGISLKSGVSDYWLARATSYELGDGSKISPVFNNFEPFFWMSSIGAIRKSARAPLYNYIIVRKDSAAGPFYFTASLMNKVLPPGYVVYDCPGIPYNILFYPNARLNDTVTKYESNFFFKQNVPDSELRLNAEDLSGLIGSNKDNYRLAKSPDDAPGFLVTGPYLSIGKGAYQIEINYDAEQSSADIVAFFDVGRFNDPTGKDNLTFVKQSLLPGQGCTAKAEILITKNNFRDLEVRVWFYGHGLVGIKSISIKRMSTPQRVVAPKIAEASSEHPSTKFFYSASELPSSIGTTTGNARLASDASEQPGFLTFGPYITLPAGKYHVLLQYEASGNEGAIAGHWDIGRFNSPGNEWALHNENLDSSRQTANAIINLPEGVSGLEVRTFFSGSGRLSVKSIEIQKLQSVE